jgi:hypothetical protein
LIFNLPLAAGYRTNDLTVSGTNGLSLGLGSAVTSFAVSKANPAVVTKNAHGLSDGSFVFFTSCAGMSELNGRVYEVDNAGTNTFELKDLDSSGYVAVQASGDAGNYQATNIFVADESYNMLDPDLTTAGVDLGSIVLQVPCGTVGAGDTIETLTILSYPLAGETFTFSNNVTEPDALDWNTYDGTSGSEITINGGRKTWTIPNAGFTSGDYYRLTDIRFSGTVTVGANCVLTRCGQ